MNDLILKDKELLVFLNNMGSERADYFWFFITNQFYLTPLFLFVFYLAYKQIGWKHLGIVILFLTLLIVVTDQSTNLFKYIFQRPRPINDTDVNTQIRILVSRSSFSFFSGHASNSMAVSLFMFLILKRYYKYAVLIFLFPLIFAYSRIYLGLHFPSDILVGYFFGMITGFVFYLIYDKWFLESEAQQKKTLIIAFVSVLVYLVMCSILTSQLRH